MSIAQHAEQILAAWHLADPQRFETELESALCCCKRAGTNIYEIEQQELLESVVERLQGSRKAASNPKQKFSAQGLSAGIALLQHLSHREAA